MGVFQTATGSTVGAIGMSVPFVVLAYSMTLNSVAAASRQAWAFGRDGGLPWSPWFHKVHVIYGQPLPLNSMLSTLVMTIVLGLINLGSAEAFNSINGLISGAIALTYALSIGCVLWRRLFGQPLPYARWSLGRYGIAINATGFLFELFVMIMSFFPLFSTVTAYVSGYPPPSSPRYILTRRLPQENNELGYRHVRRRGNPLCDLLRGEGPKGLRWTCCSGKE